MASKKANQSKESFLSKYGIYVAILIILVAFLVVTLVTGGNKEKGTDTKNKEGEVTSISAADFISKSKEDEVMVTVFAQTTCSWCNKFKPVVNEVLGENTDLTIYWIDVDIISESEYNSLGKAYEELASFGTPYTIFTKDGEKVDEISGYVEKSELLSKLEEHDLLK